MKDQNVKNIIIIITFFAMVISIVTCSKSGNVVTPATNTNITINLITTNFVLASASTNSITNCIGISNFVLNSSNFIISNFILSNLINFISNARTNQIVIFQTTNCVTNIFYYNLTNNAGPLGLSIIIISPTNNAFIWGNTTITGTASGNFGLSNVQISINGAPYSNVMGTTNWSNTFYTATNISTNFMIKLRVMDLYGNTTNTTITNANYLILFNMKFMPIPGGTFTMGSNDGETGNLAFEIPAHPVTISSFYLAQYDTVYSQWANVLSWATSHGYTFDNIGTAFNIYPPQSNNPVQSINWFDVVKWCNAFSEMSGPAPCYYTDGNKTNVYRSGDLSISNECVIWNTNGFRLPTEAEWEYSCRSGSTTSFYWGNNYIGNVDPSVDFFVWFLYYGGTSTHPVGQLLPNAWGLYDISGNVFQWCWDWWGSYSSGSVTNPYGTNSGTGRLARGGSWNNGAFDLRSSLRNNYDPSYSSTFIGFRICTSIQ